MKSKMNRLVSSIVGLSIISSSFAIPQELTIASQLSDVIIVGANDETSNDTTIESTESNETIEEETSSEEASDVTEETSSEEASDVTEETSSEETSDVTEDTTSEETSDVEEETSSEEIMPNTTPKEELENKKIVSQEKSVLDEIAIDENGIISYTGTSTSIGELFIPREINGKVVKGIAKEGFASRGITKLTFAQDSEIVSIGEGAFKNYYDRYDSQEDQAKNNKIQEITFPPSVKVIEANAFEKNRTIIKIDFNNVEEIGSYAFYLCTGVNTVNMQNIKTIGNSAFNSTRITGTLDLPNVEHIGNHSFYNNSITKLNILKDAVIEGNAFTLCGSLREVYAPDLTKVGESAFYKCSNLQTIYFPKVIEIGDEAFYECKNLVSISFPETIKIGEWAFRGCEKLETIYFPKLQEIGRIAFARCISLTSINFPDVTKVGESAFSGCENIQEVNLPKVKVINQFTFAKCYKLRNVYLESVEYLYNYAFDSTDIEVLYLPKTIKYHSTYAFLDMNSLKSVYVDQYRKANDVQPNDGTPITAKISTNPPKEADVYYLGEGVRIDYEILREKPKDIDESHIIKANDTISPNDFYIKVTYDGQGENLITIKAQDKNDETSGLFDEETRAYVYTIDDLSKLHEKTYKFSATSMVVDKVVEFTKDVKITGFVNYVDENGKHLTDIPVDITRYKSGEKVNITNIEPNSDYKFLGWSLTPNGDVITDVYMNNANINLYPVFDKNAEKATLTLDYGYIKNGLQTKDIETYKGETITLPTRQNDTMLVRDGYEFLGWTQQKGSTNYITSLEIKDKNETVYANWKKNSTTTTTTVEGGDSTTESTTASTESTESTTASTESTTASTESTTTTTSTTITTTETSTETTTNNIETSTEATTRENTTEASTETTTSNIETSTEATTRENTTEATTNDNQEIIPPIDNGNQGGDGNEGNIEGTEENTNTQNENNVYTFGNLEVVTPEHEELARRAIENINVDQESIDTTINNVVDNMTDNAGRIQERRLTEKPAFGFGVEGNISLLIVLLLLLIILITAYVVKKQIIDKEKQKDDENLEEDNTLKI